jgi:hypothetical protein
LATSGGVTLDIAGDGDLSVILVLKCFARGPRLGIADVCVGRLGTSQEAQQPGKEVADELVGWLGRSP